MTILIQLVGVMAQVPIMLSVQFKHRRQILIMQVLGSSLWALHFALLGAWTGLLLDMLAAVRTLLFYKYDGPKRPKLLYWVVIFAAVIAAVFSWQGIASSLALVGMILTTTALWQRSEQAIRALLAVSTVFWFSYGVMMGSYAAMLAAVSLAVSSIVALVRYRRAAAAQKNAVKYAQ